MLNGTVRENFYISGNVLWLHAFFVKFHVKIILQILIKIKKLKFSGSRKCTAPTFYSLRNRSVSILTRTLSCMKSNYGIAF